jgi:hypothetical protein
MDRKVMYFMNKGINLDEVSTKHPDYTRIYMNVIKNENSTNITLSRDKGDVLYIVGNVDNERYSDYFLPNGFESKETKMDEQIGDNSSNPPKRSKQSTLFNFMAKN